MLDSIINSINNKNVITFTYRDAPRKAEPHAIGISKAGNIVLKCYQTEGGHVTPGKEWDLCYVKKIQNLVITDESFPSARPGYQKDDQDMTAVYTAL